MPDMTLEAATQLVRAKGYECIGLVVVHTTQASGGFVWLRPDYPDRAQLLQMELNYLVDGEVGEVTDVIALKPS
jgi:hypothetical protein